jgi:F-type H+-transporting ATPase subunit b
MEIISNIALISINETLVVQLISFLMFVFIINRVMFRPLRDSMVEREEYMTGLSRQIRDSEIEITRMLNRLKSQEASVRKEANASRLALEDEGNRKAAEILAEVYQEISELKRKTEAEVQSQLNEAKKFLDQESEALSVKVMEKVLGRRLSHG